MIRGRIRVWELARGAYGVWSWRELNGRRRALARELPRLPLSARQVAVWVGGGTAVARYEREETYSSWRAWQSGEPVVAPLSSDPEDSPVRPRKPGAPCVRCKSKPRVPPRKLCAACIGADDELWRSHRQRVSRLRASGIPRYTRDCQLDLLERLEAGDSLAEARRAVGVKVWEVQSWAAVWPRFKAELERYLP